MGDNGPTEMQNQQSDGDQTYLGTVLINVSYLAMALSTLLMKILFIRVPGLDPAECLFMKEVVCLLIWTVAVNRNLKYYLYDIVS